LHYLSRMITVTDLKKSYGSTVALKGISFTIHPGEFYGLLGPNGAGKSTTIGIMSTLVNPDNGTVVIDGNDLKKNPKQCKQVIGVVPQELALYNELSAVDNLMFWGSLYGVSKSDLQKRIDETLKLFGLYDRRNDKVKTYSGGMKRRINIASALLHNPKVLFMDEPTVGIDPQSRNLIFEVVEKLHKEGMTIVYTTHYMEEAERFCDRIGIIDNGTIIAQGTLDELKAQGGEKESLVITGTGISDDKVAKLKSAGFIVSAGEGKLSFIASNMKTEMPKMIVACNDAGIEIEHIDIHRVNLETVFLSLTGKQLRD
jgi:ABC-2 type transport system ATP-binding protein